MTIFSRKNKQISKYSKEQTWKNYMNKFDNRIAQCYNCDNHVKFPKELRHHYENPDSILNYVDIKNRIDIHGGINILDAALFEHVIHDDSTEHDENYIIQCKTCNEMTHKNITNECVEDDIVMLDAHIFGFQNMTNKYSDSEYSCSKITSRGKQCNRPRHSNNLCSLHIYG